MKPPLFIIAPPRSRTGLLERLLDGHAACTLLRTPDAAECFGRRVSIQARTGLDEAIPLWSWLLESWPFARIVFLERDQGEIELSMLATQKDLQWIPKWGKCTGCCGRQVKGMHEAFQEFHALNPSRTAIVKSADLLTFEKADAAITRALGSGLDSWVWEREIRVVTSPRRSAPAGDDLFTGPLTVEAVERLPGPAKPAPPDPFTADLRELDMAGIAGPPHIAKVEAKVMFKSPRPELIPKPDGLPTVTGSEVVVWTLRYGDAPWIGECTPTLDAWCVRHGYSLRVAERPPEGLADEKFDVIRMIRDFLDGPKEWMIFVDADVFIHPSAPGWPAVPGFLAAHDKPMSMRHWNEWLRRFFPAVEARRWTYRNSGVWSLDRKAAQSFLDQVDLSGEWISGVREQHQFNVWAIFAHQRGMPCPVLPPEWNQLAKYESGRAAWFYHLAGDSGKKSFYLQKLRDQHWLPRPPLAFEDHEPHHEAAVVWPWLPDGGTGEELRFSMRAVERYFRDRDCPLYVLGDTPPPWLVPGGRVRFLRMDGYGKNRREGMFEARVRGYQIARKVLWMNDDIFILRAQGWDDFEAALYDSDMTSRLSWLLDSSNVYQRWVGESFSALLHHGCREFKRFSTHTPVLYEIAKVREIFRKFHITHKGSFANLYHNWHRTECRRVTDEKAARFPVAEAARFLCHGNFALSEETQTELERLFPVTPPWER